MNVDFREDNKNKPRFARSDKEWKNTKLMEERGPLALKRVCVLCTKTIWV